MSNNNPDARFARRPSLLLLPFAFCLFTCATAHAADFKFGAQTLTVPDGFEVELIAAPPLVDRPINACFDEQGRLYVTDSAGMAGSPQKQLETLPHRVVRLEDSAGTGRFDKSAVFAERMMFPEGCLWHDGALYVSAPPHIWKLSDTDGDGIADKRDVWFDGKTLTGCANDLHGPYLGRDGWIYWCKGAFAQQTYERPGKPPLITRAAHIFRARPDGSGIEPVLTGGMDNPVGVAMNSSGERFLSCTFFQNPGGGKRDGLIHAIYGGVYGKIHDVIDGHKTTGDVMPVLSHMGSAAPSGIVCCDSNALGADFRENIFTSCFNLRKVVRSVLVRNGATYTTRDSDFLVSDSPDFHPTDVLEDADGSLIVVDTGGWYKICCPTSQLAKPDVLGAIYRVRRKGAPKVDDARGLKISWSELKPAALAEFLGDERHAVRQRAIHELGKRGDVGAILKILTDAKSVEARRNAVWALARIDGLLAREATRTALNDADTSVVHAAIHAASLHRDGGALERLLALAGGDDPALARAAAEALGRIGDKRAVPVLLEANQSRALDQSRVRKQAEPASDAQRILEHSIIYALIEIGDAPGTAAGLSSENSRVRRAALVALDQMDGGGLKPDQVTPLLNSKDEVLKHTAAWITGHRAEWGDALARHFREILAAPPADEAERAELENHLARLGKSKAIQELLAATLRDSENGKIIALRAMARSGVKEAPAAWLDGISQLLVELGGRGRPPHQEQLLPQAIATSRALPLPKAGHAPLTTALLDVGRQSALPAETRLSALAGAGRLNTVDAPLFEFLTANISLTQPLASRSAAASVLAKAELAPDQQLALADALKNAGPMELQQLLPAFASGSAFQAEGNQNLGLEARATLGLKLVAALKTSPGSRGLRADLLKPLFAKYPKAVQDAGQELLANLNEDATKQAEHLKDLAAQMPAGDVRRGQAVFLNTKAACVSCHAIGYAGGQLGPDLTHIGKSRTERDLLEALVYPSASFVRSYEPFTVLTKDGERFSGIIRKDAPDEIVLATGPQIEQRVPRANVAKMQPGTVSMMPDGLDKILSPQELADLIAFLKAAK